MANLDLIRGRQVVIPLTNRSGSEVAEGDVVILDSTSDESFKTTTTARYDDTLVGVAQETIANLGVGRILVAGYAPLVNVDAAVTRLHFMETFTVAKQAHGNAARRTGSTGQFLSSGTTPSAHLWGMAD
jgi:bifunctional DNA-binding transcriptional regulator/antitoxin component of YhaV-PrlF toxin-antitoxin module